MKRARSAPRLAIVAVLAGFLAVAGAACPSRDLVVQVTDAGAQTLVLACESFRSACQGMSCKLNRFLCDQMTCKLRASCDAGNNPQWKPEQSMGFKLLLLEANADGIMVENESRCLPLNLRPCISDPAGDAGCVTAPVNVEGCIAAAISTQVDAALVGGMTFPGFTSTDNVALVAAFYHKPGDEETCDTSTEVDASACDRANLMAVAGLAAPIGRTTFDITCASCQGGTLSSNGPDNAPCPMTNGNCFLDGVLAALVAAGDP